MIFCNNFIICCCRIGLLWLWEAKPFVRFSQLSRHVAEKGSVENRDSKQPRHCTGSQREETAEEVILQRLLRQMKVPVFVWRHSWSTVNLLWSKSQSFISTFILQNLMNPVRDTNLSYFLSNVLGEYCILQQSKIQVGWSFEIKSTKKCSNINLTADNCCPGGVRWWVAEREQF